MCSLNDYDKLDLDDQIRGWLREELESVWHKYYLPVRGTVLDLGAGCGETVLFFLSHGAERVVAVESDPARLVKLAKNWGRDKRVMIINAHVDSAKIDVDGDEVGWTIMTHNALIRHVATPGEAIWKIG